MSAQLDIHWRDLLPEVDEPEDDAAVQLRERYVGAERRARQVQQEASERAEVISISWLRRRRAFMR